MRYCFSKSRIQQQEPLYAQRGFTFLEIVISIAILAVIMGVTYSCLNQILRSKKILDDARDGKAVADAVLSRMVKEFQVAQNTDVLLAPRENPTVPYVGQPRLMSRRQEGPGGIMATEISFISTSIGQFRPDGQAQSDLVQITYRVEPDPDDSRKEKLRLIREETPLISPAQDAYKKNVVLPDLP